jgi:hypothetical protein
VGQQSLVQRPANFVNFLMDELREIQRVTDAPSGMGRELPPVKASPRGAASPSKSQAHGAGAL